jgi:predicted unusual protein kinase regulating ubiquinone biosynthesis (AarF/ABC1/UbiB family)
MRGAAMKLGQLLSLEAADFLPPEAAEVLASLRDAAATPTCSPTSRTWWSRACMTS